MQENWSKYIIDSDKKLYFDLIAAKVYDDLIKNVFDNKDLINSQEKRDDLYEQIQNRFDSTTDLFVKSVTGYSLTTGIYFILEGLSTRFKMDKYSGKRFREFADKAANSAMQLAVELVHRNKQYNLAASLVEIAIQLVNKKNMDTILFELNQLINSIKFSNNVSDKIESFDFIVPSINYLLEKPEYRTVELFEKIEEMIIFSVSQGDTANTESSKYNLMGFDCIFPLAFDLKIKWFQKKKDINKVKEVAKEYAKVYEQLAEERFNAGGINLEGTIMHLIKAIEIYQKYELTNSEELKHSKLRLDEVKRILSEVENPSLIIRDTNLKHYLNEQQQSQLNEVVEHFKELEHNKKIEFLIDSVPFITRQEITEKRKRSKQNNQFYEVFPVSIRNGHEHITFEANDEETRENLALFESIQLRGSVLWINLLQDVLNEKMQVDFSEIIKEHPILSKRLHFVNKSFELFFSGDIYSGLYLLLPQVEWWFREVTIQGGEQTSNLKKFPVEETKTLTPIFQTEALKSYIGEDKHWLFKKLMTAEPMNVRNKVAHGLEFNDNGYCAYFVLCVIKLLLEQVKSLSE
ncbi:hypothetical protein ACIJDO_000204 [Enterococcus hirae]